MCYKLLLAQRTELIQLNSIREKFGTGSQLITSVTNTRRQKFTINFQSLHNLWKKNTTKRRKLKLKSKKKGKGIPRQADVALGVPGRLRPYNGGRSSAKRTGRLHPRRNPWYSFSEAESTSGHMVLSEGTTEKIPSDTTGDGSRVRSTSSAAP